ncbi:amidohydrolase family protein [Streptomyces sp. HC44]|uniref:Amidohydrolase family protein n=1 Tax=Streptomyces scabichelini TaxID=2711217 RepID=A0A6G4VJD6_9ACTN|nr:amidohydrolase family protein [Streptomyces scabichelini]NGO14229.1 amidohydrolase family protein [Streptomyces scabichelini]
MVIDCHCHAGQGPDFDGPWDSAPLDAYARRAAAAGIRHTVLLPVFHSDYAVANRQVGRIVADRPERYSGFAMVHPRRDAGRIHALLAEATGRWGLRGIKVHRHDARITREVCGAARTFRLPVLYDVMGEVATVELFATAYPDVDFIIPHLGSFADDWSAQLALVDHLVRHPNVHADTSGVRRFDLLLRALERAGPEKLLFGSDGPWLHPGVELAKVKALALQPADEAKITGGNLLRLLGPPIRAAGSRHALHHRPVPVGRGHTR